MRRERLRLWDALFVEVKRSMMDTQVRLWRRRRMMKRRYNLKKKMCLFCFVLYTFCTILYFFEFFFFFFFFLKKKKKKKKKKNKNKTKQNKKNTRTLPMINIYNFIGFYLFKFQ